MMKRNRLLIVSLCLLLLLSGCGKKSSNKVTVVSTDDIIKEANNSYKSSDSYDSSLYQSDVVFDEYNPFVQPYSKDIFEEDEMDYKYFSPLTNDYLIGCFDKKHIVLYSYDIGGDVIDVKGKIVYESENKLLKDNKGLTSGSYNDKGYTYFDNVLYYKMNEDDLMGIEAAINKYDLLKLAASGKWDKYQYYFSIPYENEDIADYEIKQKGSLLSYDLDLSDIDVKSEIYNLFTTIMKGNSLPFGQFASLFHDDVDKKTIEQYYNIAYRSPSEFENCEVIIAMEYENIFYGVLEFYTIPEGYPDAKVDNYMFGGLVIFDGEGFKFAQTEELFEETASYYYYSVMSSGAYDAHENGWFAKRFWIPFNMDEPFAFKDVITAKVLEVYDDEDGNYYATIMFANDTNDDKVLQTLDRLVVESDKGLVFDVSCDFYYFLNAHEILIEKVRVPAEYVNVTSFSDVYVSAFEYTIVDDYGPPQW